jgi:predicted unusual protein kinase regulating ubiquinone biosynthesis (AarF/ABC1/UbiB family)
VWLVAAAVVVVPEQAVWLQKVDPKTDGAARDWVAIYDECSRILYQEIDYTQEGKNADQ